MQNSSKGPLTQVSFGREIAIFVALAQQPAALSA